MGKLKLSRKAFNRYNSGNNANLGYSLGLTYYDDQYLALTDDSIFQYDFGGDAVSEITGGTPALNSDLQVIYGLAYFTEDANLSSFNGSTVTSSLYSLTTGVPHPMTVFDSFTTFKLAIGDGNLVHLLNSSHADSGTDLVLPAQYQVTSLTYRNGYLYIGTKNLNGGEAKVFVWDGNSANANFEIPVGATQIYSIIPYKTSVAFITNKGQLFAVSGNSPVELAILPVASHSDAIWDDGTAAQYDRSYLLEQKVLSVENVPAYPGSVTKPNVVIYSSVLLAIPTQLLAPVPSPTAGE